MPRKSIFETRVMGRINFHFWANSPLLFKRNWQEIRRFGRSMHHPSACQIHRSISFKCSSISEITILSNADDCEIACWRFPESHFKHWNSLHRLFQSDFRLISRTLWSGSIFRSSWITQRVDGHRSIFQEFLKLSRNSWWFFQDLGMS